LTRQGEEEEGEEGEEEEDSIIKELGVVPVRKMRNVVTLDQMTLRETEFG
jgi:hypothetical protein